MKADQDRLAPASTCFGCGPANAKGLHVKSHWEGDKYVATWHAEPHHQAWPGVVNGGIVGSLMDCHGNWCAATTLMRERKLEDLPATVTSEFHVHLRRPTPSGAELHLVAKPLAVEGDKVTVEIVLEADGKVCASCRAVYVAVKEGHPAFHRWD